jgi:hypothetical protein
MASTKERSWQTWAGSRSDVDRAVREAADALSVWGTYAAVVTGSVTYANDLTDTIEGVDAIANLHRSDLPGIRQLWIEIRPDRDAYYAERTRLHEVWEVAAEKRAERGEDIGSPAEPPPLISASILIRFSWAGRGLRLEVNGPDRHQVVGLFDRLEEILTRRHVFLHVDPDAVQWIGGGVLLLPSISLGFWLSHVLGTASRNGKWDVGEIVGMAIGAAAAVGFGIGFRQLYPTLELIEDDQKTRGERFGAFFLSALLVVVLGVISAALYDAAT